MLSCSLMSNFFDCRGTEQQLIRTKKNSIMVQQNPWRLDHIRSCCCCCCCASSLSSWDFFASSYDHKDSPAAVDLLQSHCNTEKKKNKCLLNSFIPLLPLLSLDNSAYNKYHQSPRTLMQYSSPLAMIDSASFCAAAPNSTHNQDMRTSNPKHLSLWSLWSLWSICLSVCPVWQMFFSRL